MSSLSQSPRVTTFILLQSCISKWELNALLFVYWLSLEAQMAHNVWKGTHHSKTSSFFEITLFRDIPQMDFLDDIIHS